MKHKFLHKIVRKIIKKKEFNYKEFVRNKYSLPYGLPTIDIALLLPELDEKIDNYTFLEGTSLPIDIALLKGLARKIDNCNYFEIGTWRGESIVNVAQTASKCTSLSLSEEEMIKLNWPKEFIKLNRYYSKGINNIEHIGHNSITYNYSIIKEKYDLIFIDGEHSFEAVKIDTINSLNIRRNNNSLILWHDYGITTETVNWKVLAGILDGVPSNLHQYLYHVSNTLCAILIQKDFPKKYIPFPAEPNKHFEITIKMFES